MTTGKIPSDQELQKEGWTKQFFASGTRLREATELYESMELEVHLEPVRAEDLGCQACHLPKPCETVDVSYVIYTRPRENTEQKKSPDKNRQKDELW